MASNFYTIPQDKRRLKDKKITLYKKTTGVNDVGMPSTVYRPLHPGTLWAYVRHQSSREYFAAKAAQITETLMFEVNWRADLTLESLASTFIVYKGNWFNIARLDTYEDNKTNIRLYANSMKAPAAADIQPYQP